MDDTVDGTGAAGEFDANNAPRAAVHNLADLVRRAAAREGARPALIFRDTTLSWSEVDARVDQAAAAFHRLGLVEGDRLAIGLHNGLDFPVVYFGALRAGLVVVPVNPGFTSRELTLLLGDSGATAFVCGAELAAAVDRGALPGLAHLLVAGGPADSLHALIDEARGVPPRTAAGGESLAVLIYTSGTSGRPKGAMLSHRALLANLEQVAQLDPPVLTPADVVLLVLPMFHVYGLNPGLGQVAYTGCTAVLAERFDPVGALDAIVAHGVTNVPGAPPMYVAWSLLPHFGEAFARVRVAVCGADQLPAAVQNRLREATGRYVAEGYGLTETAPVLTSTLMSEVQKLASIGKPLPGVELRLVDASGEDVFVAGSTDEPDDEDERSDPGEIVVRGANLFSGYWPDGANGPDSGGWWRTGDVAYADEDGDLFLVDRLKELILVSGFNVYPREVEEVLYAHPAIAEAAVISAPHPYTGETVKAYVVVRPGTELSAEGVIAHCERALARFKCPTVVEFVRALPHSATGKVSKGRLRKAARRGIDPAEV